MKYKDSKYNAYVVILNNELLPAMGCTEPIAIAYCAAILKDTLQGNPEEIEILVSGNIIKNVKSVTVPNTNGMHGIEAACGIGIIAGDSKKKLEVISNVNEKQISLLPKYLQETKISVKHKNTSHKLYIEIIGKYNNDCAKVIIQDEHTHVILIEKNNEIVFKAKNPEIKIEEKIDKSVLNIKNIVEFADICDINDIKKVLDKQIKYNMAIANEGLQNNYGANIGKTILNNMGCTLLQNMKALASAGSDARMNGCNMPVVINSGSGNQGITVSVPVIVYAKEHKMSDELLYRALAVSNLCNIHMKNNIGALSAYCGVVMAGAASGVGIAYLEGGKLDAVAHTLVNALAIVSGVVCDGAKSSCAAKIASSVEAGLLGYYMYKDGNQFYGGDGIVKKGVENTIKAVGSLARVGMCETDKEIIQIMME